MSGIKESIAVLGIPLGMSIMLLMRLFGYNVMDKEGFEGVGAFIGILYYSGLITLVGIVGFFLWLLLLN